MSRVAAIILVVGISMFCATPPAGAEMLTGDKIPGFIAGRTILLNTGYGVSLPLSYKPDGEVIGDGRGTGLGRFFAPKETGRWWVRGDALCQKWPKWYDGRIFCFSIRKTGDQTIRWQRDDGLTGTASISG